MSFRSRSRTIQPIVTRQRSHSSSRIGNGSPYISSSLYTGTSNSVISTPSSYYITPSVSSAYSSSTYSKDLDYTPRSINTSKYNGNSVYSSPYSDRYHTPYSSYFENGVTTASLNLQISPSNYPKTYDTTSSSTSSRKRDFTPVRNSSNLLNTREYSESNPSVNGIYTTSQIALGRSQSLRDHERKSRTRNRKEKANANQNSLQRNDKYSTSISITNNSKNSHNKFNNINSYNSNSNSINKKSNSDDKFSSNSNKNRSMSISSEKSEGYESGNEVSGVAESRLGSSNQSDSRNDDDGEVAKENGEIVDYKALYEAAMLDNNKLKTQLKKKDDEITTAKLALERFTNASKNSLTEIEKRERRAMERKMSEMEEELKQLDALKTENQRLKDENGALIRVISKLSK